MPNVDAKISSYEPRKEAIGSLLSLNNPSIIVPDWQRNYSWKNEHIEAFWNDLVYFMDLPDNGRGDEYFLGSVVIVKTAEGRLNLLDGQQRLATSAILLSVLRDAVMQYNVDAGKQIQNSYLVGYDYVANTTVHKLRLNIYDRDFFRQLILEPRDGAYVEPAPTIASHYLLSNARQMFTEFLSILVQDLPPKEAFARCMQVSRCLLQQMTVIAVYSTDEDSAAEVFETLNDRGIGLSTPDLLRNFIIRRTNPAARDTVVELWGSIVSFETDGAIKSYLRHYWVSRYGDVKTQSLYREIKGVIVRDALESVALTTSLSTSAENYKLLLKADTANEPLNDVLREVIELGASANILYPVLLAILEELDDQTAVTAASLLLNVFMRHSVFAGLENSRLENRIYKAARDLRVHRDLGRFSDTIVDGSPTDEQTKLSFEKLSVGHNGTRRLILRRFEMAERTTEELKLASPANVHIEHVYPQTPAAANRWPEHGKYIERIGNLTLLSARLNRSISNGTFDAKRPHLANSELLTTKQVAEYENWGPEAIDDRQEKMAETVAALWPLKLI